MRSTGIYWDDRKELPYGVIETGRIYTQQLTTNFPICFQETGFSEDQCMDKALDCLKSAWDDEIASMEKRGFNYRQMHPFGNNKFGKEY